MKIGVLSTLNNPFLGQILLALKFQGIRVDAIILDGLDISEKNKKIIAERTEGRIPFIPLHDERLEQSPFYFVNDHNSLACAALLKHLDIDLLLNGGTPRIIKEVLLNVPRVGIVNCHPGLLPEFRGRTCVEWAIYHDKQAGNTVHFMDKAIDCGPIVIQEGLTFSKNDRYVDIRCKVYRQQFDLLARGVKKIIDEELLVSQLPSQSQGESYPVMDDDKYRLVLDKLEQGRYAFQL